MVLVSRNFLNMILAFTNCYLDLVDDVDFVWSLSSASSSLVAFRNSSYFWY